MPVIFRSLPTFHMAQLNHGPGPVVPRAPDHSPSHVQAFFRPVDDAPTTNVTNNLTNVCTTAASQSGSDNHINININGNSNVNGSGNGNGSGPSRNGSAPVAPLESPTKRSSSSPFTFTPSSSHARVPPFPAHHGHNGVNINPTNGINAANGTNGIIAAPPRQSQGQPSTLEGAQGLMQLRQNAHTPASETAPSLSPAPPSNGFRQYQPQLHPPSSATPNPNCGPQPPVDHPTHPSISTSPDRSFGRPSHTSSGWGNTDIIPGPFKDSIERNGQSQNLPQPPFVLDQGSSQPQELGGAPPTAHPTIKSANLFVPSGVNSFPPQHPLPSTLFHRESSTLNSNGDIMQNRDQAAPRRLYDPSAPILPVHGIRCHCRSVPRGFLNILDEKAPADINNLAKLYGACRGDLCPLHINAYAKLLTNALEAAPAPMAAVLQQAEEEQQEDDKEDDDPMPTFTGAATQWKPVAIRTRRTSTPGIPEYELELPSKRRRVADGDHLRTHINGAKQPRSIHPQHPQGWPPPPPRQQSCRPSVNVKSGEAFRNKVLRELSLSFTDRKEDDWSRGETTNRYIYKILDRCLSPNTDPRKGTVDAGFLTGEEAATVLERGAENIPIFTEGQQQFRWTNQSRPIVQLFRRMEDLTREVSVQIPSRDFEVPSYEMKPLSEIRDRFLSDRPSPDPWNILDLRSPLPPTILPSFLTGENCLLLSRIRDSLLEGHSAERTKGNREEWNEWTDLLEWVLMSEGGHNTAPHMDSHGWSTWITIQEGHFGFGWLSRPTTEEQDAWMKDPLEYAGGNWRYVILKPGQTVFFPSGTVHFVFRLHAEQTLALGGHLLQWTSLQRWVQVILYQLKNPNITNEDLGQAPLKYIRIARRLAENRMATCRVGTMGTIEHVQMFLALATVTPPPEACLEQQLTDDIIGGGKMVF